MVDGNGSAPTDAAPKSSPERLLDGAEDRARRLASWLREPRRLAVAVAILVVAGALVRLPVLADEEAWFNHHADEATYFNQGLLYVIDVIDRKPLEHGGSGLPFLLEFVFERNGIQPSEDLQAWLARSAVDQWHDHDEKPLNDQQRRTGALAYGLNAMLGAALVAATWLLARQVLPALSALGSTSFIAFDPFQISVSGQIMTEAAYTLCVILALGAVFKARDHPGWLLATAPALAWAHYLRINGIVMMVTVLGFAAVYLPHVHRRLHPAPKGGRKNRQARGKPFPWRWTVGAFALFWLLSMPYLEWRDEYLPSGFDYGTNSRMFADQYWDFSDPYWQNSSYGDRGPRESLSDFFEAHTVGDAVDRLWTSFSWQVDDVFVGKAWHDGKRGHGDVVVLHPILLAGLAAAVATAWRRRDLWFVPALLLVSYAPVAWTYAIHDSPRYHALLGPAVAVAAVVGWAWLAHRTRWPHVVAAAVMSLFGILYAVRPLGDGLRALGVLGQHEGLWELVLLMASAAVALATAPFWMAAWKART